MESAPIAVPAAGSISRRLFVLLKTISFFVTFLFAKVQNFAAGAAIADEQPFAAREARPSSSTRLACMLRMTIIASSRLKPSWYSAWYLTRS